MAPQTRRSRDKRSGAAAGPPRRPSRCTFCTEKIEDVDWKDSLLRRFVDDKGKIRPRRATGSCRRHQVQVGGAVKRAREMALLPGVTR